MKKWLFEEINKIGQLSRKIDQKREKTQLPISGRNPKG